MDDPLFALLDDIAETARDGSHHDGGSHNFGNHQLLDDEPQYYESQQLAQSFHGNSGFPQDGRRDESRNPDKGYYRRPQGEQAQCMTPLRRRHDTKIIQEGSRHFWNHGSQIATGSSSSSRQVNNASMRPTQQQHHLMEDEYMSSGR
jgi:hypothetical protein